MILESPYSGATPEEVARNVRYARACLRDSLLRGEAPLASHLLYTQEGVLDDAEPEERAKGIAAGLAWGVAARETVAYCDLGLSAGMQQGIARALAEGRRVDYRHLGGGWGVE